MVTSTKRSSCLVSARRHAVWILTSASTQPAQTKETCFSRAKSKWIFQDEFLDWYLCWPQRWLWFLGSQQGAGHGRRSFHELQRNHHCSHQHHHNNSILLATHHAVLSLDLYVFVCVLAFFLLFDDSNPSSIQFKEGKHLNKVRYRQNLEIYLPQP